MDFIFDLNVKDGDEFETSVVFKSSKGTKYQLNFEHESCAEAWFNYIETIEGVNLQKSFILCRNTSSSYEELIAKLTKVNFGDETVCFGLRKENNDLIGFYFATQESCNKYTDKHMKFYVKK